MASPLLESAVLVSENCPDCGGTGYLVKHPRARPQSAAAVEFLIAAEQGRKLPPEQTEPCGGCEEAGRQVREVPLSEFLQMLDGVALSGARERALPSLEGR